MHARRLFASQLIRLALPHSDGHHGKECGSSTVTALFCFVLLFAFVPLGKVWPGGPVYELPVVTCSCLAGVAFPDGRVDTVRIPRPLFGPEEVGGARPDGFALPSCPGSGKRRFAGRMVALCVVLSQ